VYTAGRAIPGAAEAIGRLRRAGIPLVFATNTTRHPRRVLVERLGKMGIPVEPSELFTAPRAAAAWLRGRGARRLMLLLPEATWDEFDAFQRDERAPEHVVVGDLGASWTYGRLNAAFLALLGGAELVAIHKNRFWNPGDGPRLDAGPFVAALEYASGKEATLVGKPSPAFFRAAAAALGVPMDHVLVVGDAVLNDVRGGRSAGCRAVAVRTGSFREEDLQALEEPPEAVLGSIAELPAYLGL
jgi:HAD superfamily hydrolase (TIGR01458 family)